MPALNEDSLCATPHNNYLQISGQNPGLMSDLLHYYTDQKVSRHIDLTSLQLQSGRNQGTTLTQYQADLVYSAKLTPKAKAEAEKRPVIR